MAQADRAHETSSDQKRNPVRDGGIAPDDAATEDVTRDTYGYPGSSGVDTGITAEEARRRAEDVLAGGQEKR